MRVATPGALHYSVTGPRHFCNTRPNSALSQHWINFVHLLFILLIWLAPAAWGSTSAEQVSGLMASVLDGARRDAEGLFALPLG